MINLKGQETLVAKSSRAITIHGGLGLWKLFNQSTNRLASSQTAVIALWLQSKTSVHSLQHTFTFLFSQFPRACKQPPPPPPPPPHSGSSGSSWLLPPSSHHDWVSCTGQCQGDKTSVQISTRKRKRRTVGELNLG